MTNLPPTLDYDSPGARRTSRLRRVAHWGALFDAFLYGTFHVTRTIQLRQADPYNNQWTGFSTLAYLGFLMLWLVLFVATMVLIARKQLPNALSCVWIVAAGAYIVFAIIQMARFVFV